MRFLARHFTPSSLILDLGCGAGRHSLFIERSGHRAVGVDYSMLGLRHTALALRGDGSPVRLVRGVMQALPFSNMAFAGVVAYGVLYYTNRGGYQTAIDELWRVLKPNGKLLVVTRTTRDGRFGQGVEVEPDTFILETNATNEAGMPVHFLQRTSVEILFQRFKSCAVDWVDQSTGGGALLNSDWVIEATK